MKYFSHINDIQSLKNTYRKLIKENHPDKGGDTATCQALNAEYAERMQQLIKQDTSTKYRDTASTEEKTFWENQEERCEAEKKVAEALQKIIALDGLEIEIVGVWLWVGGNTKQHKEALKEAGFYWFNKKKMWAFAGKKSRGRGNTTMDEVRAKYGSQVVRKKQHKQLARV